MIEMVLEHMAKAIGMDPLEFREKNILQLGDQLFNGKTFEEDKPNPATTLLEIAKNKAKYGERREAVELFNRENRWKKRGLSLIPVRYMHNYFGTRYHVHISVYADDGTIAVSHGGIEMGQGINTKVAQVIAKELDVPLDIIRIKSTSNLIGPNNSVTGGSMGSECCASVSILVLAQLLKSVIWQLQFDNKNVILLIPTPKLHRASKICALITTDKNTKFPGVVFLNRLGNCWPVLLQFRLLKWLARS